jgi:hypothetical protein
MNLTTSPRNCQYFLSVLSLRTLTNESYPPRADHAVKPLMIQVAVGPIRRNNLSIKFN